MMVLYVSVIALTLAVIAICGFLCYLLWQQHLVIKGFPHDVVGYRKEAFESFVYAFNAGFRKGVEPTYMIFDEIINPEVAERIRKMDEEGLLPGRDEEPRMTRTS